MRLGAALGAAGLLEVLFAAEVVFLHLGDPLALASEEALGLDHRGALGLDLAARDGEGLFDRGDLAAPRGDLGLHGRALAARALGEGFGEVGRVGLAQGLEGALLGGAGPLDLGARVGEGALRDLLAELEPGHVGLAGGGRGALGGEIAPRVVGGRARDREVAALGGEQLFQGLGALVGVADLDPGLLQLGHELALVRRGGLAPRLDLDGELAGARAGLVALALEPVLLGDADPQRLAILLLAIEARAQLRRLVARRRQEVQRVLGGEAVRGRLAPREREIAAEPLGLRVERLRLAGRPARSCRLRRAGLGVGRALLLDAQAGLDVGHARQHLPEHLVGRALLALGLHGAGLGLARVGLELGDLPVEERDLVRARRDGPARVGDVPRRRIRGAVRASQGPPHAGGCRRGSPRRRFGRRALAAVVTHVIKPRSLGCQRPPPGSPAS